MLDYRVSISEYLQANIRNRLEQPHSCCCYYYYYYYYILRYLHKWRHISCLIVVIEPYSLLADRWVSTVAMSARPHSAAVCRGVQWSASRTLTSAFGCVTSSLTSSKLPSIQACNIAKFCLTPLMLEISSISTIRFINTHLFTFN